MRGLCRSPGRGAPADALHDARRIREQEGQRGHAGSRLRFKSNICFPARNQDAQRKGIDC